MHAGRSKAERHSACHIGIYLVRAEAGKGGVRGALVVTRTRKKSAQDNEDAATHQKKMCEFF